MRIVSFNANGIRSAARKGFFDWMGQHSPDIVCVQETKAQIDQLTDPVFSPDGYHTYYEDAEKKGYSGVAIYSRHKPQKVRRGFGVEKFDREGRYLEIDLPGLTVASLYLPSGTSGDERLAFKLEFHDAFYEKLAQLRRRRRHIVVCGDWNTAHKQIDLKNWRSNQKNSGFLPEERAWLDTVFKPKFFVDAFREINTEPDQYTWWSNRGRAYEKNVGWRIDYHVVSPSLKDRVAGAAIYKDEKFSDHAPLTIDYRLDD
ncbi:MAG: exodeoxyribonuclease III [Pseudomonadota bacterium]